MPIIKFDQSYSGHNPATIFEADDVNKTLTPLDEQTFRSKGYQFGQEKLVSGLGGLTQYAQYRIGTPQPVQPQPQVPQPQPTQQPQQQPQQPQAQPTQPKQQQATQPVAPSLDQVIQQVYNTRPDLQAVYNPDGSAKNIKDPKVAGIPTLKDWARQFGINESPLIKQAFNTPATPSGQVAGSTDEDPSNVAGSTGDGEAGLSEIEAIQDPIDFKELYSQVYTDLGLNTLKQEFESYNKQILDVKNELADKIADINDNPWLSDGDRRRSINQMNERYEGKLGNLAAFLTLTNSLYQDGVEQAKFLTTGTYEQNETLRLESKERIEKQKEAAQKIVDTYDVKTPYFNKAGTFFVSSDGHGFAKPEQFFKHAKVSSFKEAYEKGLVTDIDENKALDKAAVLDLRAEYPDAGILATDSWEKAMAKLPVSLKYQKENYIAPEDPFKNLNILNDNERALLTQFTGNPIVKDFNEVQGRKLQIDNIIANGSGGPADLALVYTFMKSLDPTSVVRESEYESAAKSGNIFAGVWAKFNGYFKEEGGRLPENVRQEFKNLADQSYLAKKQQYDNWRNQIRSIAERQGLNPDNVTVDFSDFLNPPGQEITLTPIVKPITDKSPPLLKKYPYMETLELFNKFGRNITEEEIRGTLGIEMGGGQFSNAVVAKFPDGFNGGQCGDFAHRLVEFPSVGDAKSQKIQSVRKFGILAAAWRTNVKVGDVIITDENPTYGHVAVVNAILPNGQIRLSESNFKQSHKVSNDRVVSINSPKIYGAIRGKLKV